MFISSLEKRLPDGWKIIPYSGGALYSDLRFEDKFRIFPAKRIITYDDVSRGEGMFLLLKAIYMVATGDYKNAQEQNIGSCVYKKGM